MPLNKKDKKILIEWLDQTAKEIFEDLLGQNQKDTGSSQNHIPETQDIGEIYVVFRPQEGKESKDLVQKTNLLGFTSAISEGRIKLEMISQLFHKENKAIREANKLQKNFIKELAEQRKAQIEEWSKKKKYIESRLASTVNYYGTEHLDEQTKSHVLEMQKMIGLIDKKINEIKSKLKQK